MDKICFIDKNDCMKTCSDEIDKWGYEAIGINIAHKEGLSGQNIKIAILDTGLPKHSSLQNIVSTSFTDDGLFDKMGHSTHITGIIKTIAPLAELCVIKVLDNDGLGKFEWIIEGIQHAINWKADIINLSFGTPITPPNELKNICSIAANKKNIIICAAAGNNAKKTLCYPARYNTVLSVSAIEKNGNIPKWCNRGITDVYMPSNAYSYALNSGYCMMQGTSQSAAYASGFIALLGKITKEKVLEKMNNMKNDNKIPSFKKGELK